MREIKFRAWDARQRILYDIYIESLTDAFQDKDLVIQQYTGLKDKNDKEIYEGDIVNYEDNIIGEVVYNNLSGGYCIFHSENLWSLKVNNTTMGDAWIIGNIYENSELLNE